MFKHGSYCSCEYVFYSMECPLQNNIKQHRYVYITMFNVSAEALAMSEYMGIILRYVEYICKYNLL